MFSLADKIWITLLFLTIDQLQLVVVPTQAPGTDSVLRSRPDKFHPLPYHSARCHHPFLRRLRDNVKLVQERRYERSWALGLPHSTLGGDLVMQDHG